MLKKAITKPYEKLFSDLNKTFKLCVSDITIEMVKFFTEFIDLRCEGIEILGKYGWAICSTSFIYEFKFWENTSFSFPKKIKKWKEMGKVTIRDIDDYIAKSLMKQLSRKEKRKIKNKFTRRTKDKKKIDNLFNDFKQKKYYECASTLFGLIDSEIIKFNLDDYKNGKYNISKNKENGKYESTNGKNLCNGKTGEGTIGQGWEALSILFKNNLKSFFNSEDFSPHKETDKNGEKWTKEKLFDTFVNDVKLEMDKNIGFEFLNIAYPLLIFFNDNDWKEEKPKIINRNWLMHGMCKYDDITRNDCIKLFLLYYQFICFLEADWAATIECSKTKSTTS